VKLRIDHAVLTQVDWDDEIVESLGEDQLKALAMEPLENNAGELLRTGKAFALCDYHEWPRSMYRS
jgi:hypothetical protein